MSQYWWASDHHAKHKNIIKYDSRPFASIEEHDEALVENHNSLVKPNDTVHFLGDVIFSKFMEEEDVEKYVKRFNGHKHLILGNHDDIFRGRTSGLGFDSIQDVKEIKVCNQRIFMSHYSHRVWPAKHHNSWHLYGHSHHHLPLDGSLSFDCGVNGWDYKPINFAQVKEKMKHIAIKYSHLNNDVKPAIINNNDTDEQKLDTGL